MPNSHVVSPQVFFEDVEVGSPVPTLAETPSNTLLFLRAAYRYSAITWNPQRIHFDKDHTLTEGYRDVIVHGPLRGAFLTQMLTRWIGEKGTLKKVSYANRGVAYVNETLACKGRVTRKCLEDGQGYVDCDIWVENQSGEQLTPGKATVVLPQKKIES
jgi:hydroxyacyl-ACP dehydratase HTD2-like protein with hotdog domain